MTIDMFTTSYGNPLTPSTPPHIKANPYVKSENEQFKTFIQLDYPLELYAKEISIQTQTLEEYGKEVSEFMIRLCENSKPNMELYRQQPYLTFSIRLKLIDFLLKMTIRLKILPFVFFRAVKLFDRYCSKRIVLLDQSQLIVVTCLWIASKIQGGNNHFVNLNNNTTKIKTINDIGYGCGGKYLGPTERFRLPKLHELVKLCGAKCKYDASMFKQMELHVLNTLEWSLNEPYVEEFIVQSFEFNNFNSIDNEFFKVKEFLSYLSLYSYELIDVEALELSQVMVDIINETFKLTVNSKDYQVINDEHDLPSIDPTKYRFIKKNLIKSVLSASEYIVKLFNSKGPQYFYHQIHALYKIPTNLQPPHSVPNTHQQFITATTCSPPDSIPFKRNRTDSNNSTESPPIKVNNCSSPIKIYTPNSSTANVSSPYTKIQQHIQFPSYSFNSPVSQPPSAPVPIIAAKVKSSNSNNKFYRLPSINTNQNHHHNNSQASINSCASCSTREDISMLDVFEIDYHRKYNGTPASDNDSPLFPIMKPTSISD